MRKNLFKTLGIVLALAMVFAPQAAFGGTVTWNGSSDAAWNTDANWSTGTIPVDNVDDIILTGAETNPTNNDIVATHGLVGWVFNNTCPALTITGNALDFVGTIDNQDTDTQTINLDFVGVGATVLDASAGGLVLGGTIDNGGALLTVQGAFDTTVSGIISGEGGLTKAEAGTLTLSADNTYSGATALNVGTINLGGNLGATATTIADGATLNLTKSVSNGGATTHVGTAVLDVNSYTYTSAGLYTLADTSGLNLDVSSSTASGSVDAKVAGASVNAGATMVVNITGVVADGSTYVVVDGDGGEADIAALTADPTDNSRRVSCSTSLDDNKDLLLTLSRDASATYDADASDANASAAGSALETNLANTPTGDMLTVLGTIEDLSASDTATAMDTMSPDVSAGAMDGSLAALNQFLGTVTSHLRSVRSGSTGVSTGDGIEGLEEKDVWIKGFGNLSDQGTRSGIQGYESYTYGTALGFDVLAGDDVTLGISGGYAYTEVDPKKASLNNTDINSYQGTLYGSYDGGPYYIDTAFAFAWNDYEGSRDIAFGATSRKAKADYEGQQYSGYIGGGYTFEEEGFEITPIASLQYTHLRIGDYTETEAGSLNLKVNDQSYDVLESGLGLKVAYPVVVKGITITPDIHAGWYYDYIGDKAQITSKFTGGGASFETKGTDPAQHSFDVGTQVTLLTKDDVSLILLYDLELKEDFHAHSGAVTVKYDF